MTNAGIFVIQSNGQLLELRESRYDSEAVLQQLLAQYPNLLAGDQVNPENPRRWLLVRREAGIPGGEGEGGRWAVDHLFLDQEAIPTLVEVKRSSDTRLRREVVGQMLDYAANAVAYWPAERLQLEFESSLEGTSSDVTVALREFLDDEVDPETFWARAKTNLQAGRVRMVFVADEIPAELRRIIEFLNEQLDPAEVIGVEIKQFVGGGIKSLVPRVIGTTAEAQRRKRVGPPQRQWDEPSFFSTLAQRGDQREAAVARRILEWASREGLRIWWGSGVQDASFYLLFDHSQGSQYTIAVRTGYKAAYAQFQLAQMTPPFDTIARRNDLVQRINMATGQRIAPDAKYPSVRLVDLDEGERIEGLLNVLEWVLEETRSSE